MLLYLGARQLRWHYNTPILYHNVRGTKRGNVDNLGPLSPLSKCLGEPLKTWRL